MHADVAMWRALQHRDIPRLQRALRSGANPCRPDAAGRTALHIAADHDDARLLNALLNAIPVLQRKDAVNAIDVWGEAPLHRAVVNDTRLGSTRALLRAGARINSPGALGRPPLLMADTMHAHATAQALRRRGAVDTPGPINEPGRRALLGELFGLRGQTQFGTALLPLRHGMAEAAFPWLAELLHQIVADPRLRSRNGQPSKHTHTFAAAVSQIAQAFASAGGNISRAPAELLSTIQAGQTVVLPSGTPRHAVIYIWHRGTLVSCDRSRILWVPWAKRRCHLVRTSATGLTTQDIEALQRGGVCKDRQAQRRIAALTQCTDPAQQARWQAILNAHAFKPQHVNNCVTAGAKMATYALFCLLLPGASPDRRTRWYKHLTTRLREVALNDYRINSRLPKEGPPDVELLARCIATISVRSSGAFR